MKCRHHVALLTLRSLQKAQAAGARRFLAPRAPVVSPLALIRGKPVLLRGRVGEGEGRVRIFVKFQRVKLCSIASARLAAADNRPTAGCALSPLFGGVLP